MAKIGLSLVSVRIVMSKLLWMIQFIISSNFSVLFIPFILIVDIFQLFIEGWHCGLVFSGCPCPGHHCSY